MTQVLHLPSRWNKFLVSLFTSIQSIVSVSGRISPQSWDVFHKPTSSLLFSLLVFQQLHSTLILRMPFQAHLWQKLPFSSPFFRSNDLPFTPSFGGILMLLSSTHLLVFSGACSFMGLYIQPECCALCSSSFILSSFISRPNQSAT